MIASVGPTESLTMLDSADDFSVGMMYDILLRESTNSKMKPIRRIVGGRSVVTSKVRRLQTRKEVTSRGRSSANIQRVDLEAR